MVIAVSAIRSRRAARVWQSLPPRVTAPAIDSALSAGSVHGRWHFAAVFIVDVRLRLRCAVAREGGP